MRIAIVFAIILILFLAGCTADAEKTAKKKPIGFKRCYDSDKGENPNSAGDVTLEIDNKNILFKQDVCEGSTAVREYSCPKEGSAISEKLINCQSGYACIEGECRTTTVTVRSCQDTDGGEDTSKVGTVTIELSDGARPYKIDSCETDTSVREYSCPSQGTTISERVIPCQGDYICSASACQPGCIDSDRNAADQIYEKGYLSLYDQDGLFLNLADRCEDQGSLREFFCEGRSSNSRIADCPSGCENGACKR